MALPSISSVLSFRNVLLLWCLLNLKSLPFSWHLRLLYRLLRSWYNPSNVARSIQKAAEDGATHPIFQPVSIISHSPLYEIDYNLHKSNSTYFADLDESRTALVTTLYSPANGKPDEHTKRNGYTGRTNVILGSVHTSFRREIKPYENFELRSRVLGWDRKWLIIGSFFIRPAKKGRQEVLLASSLSKYVVKKGRLTISPEECLQKAGWLPEKPKGAQPGVRDSKEINPESGSTVLVPALKRPGGQSISIPQSNDGNIEAPVPEPAIVAAEIVQKLENVASQNEQEPQIDLAMTEAPRAQDWDWHRIDMERLRGLQVAQAWLDLDILLDNEHDHTSKLDLETKVE